MCEKDTRRSEIKDRSDRVEQNGNYRKRKLSMRKATLFIAALCDQLKK